MGRVVRDARLTSRNAAQRSRIERAANVARARLVEADGKRSPVAPAVDPRVTAQHAWRHRLARCGLSAVAVLVLAAWVWSLGAERRAIEQLSPERRATIYADALQSFESMCVPPGSALTGQCRSQARFLLEFDECNAHCRAITEPLVRFRS